jgi:hypothetical protein
MHHSAYSFVVQPAPSGLGGVSARRLLCPPRRSQIGYALAAHGEIAVAGPRVTAASGTAPWLTYLGLPSFGY